MTLIERLNELLDLSPDQIVDVLTDPIATPKSMVALGVEGLRALNGRRLHFLYYSTRQMRVINDSDELGDVFYTDGVYDDWARNKTASGYKWHLVSHEGFLKLNLETYSLPDRE